MLGRALIGVWSRAALLKARTAIPSEATAVIAGCRWTNNRLQVTHAPSSHLSHRSPTRPTSRRRSAPPRRVGAPQPLFPRAAPRPLWGVPCDRAIAWLKLTASVGSPRRATSPFFSFPIPVHAARGFSYHTRSWRGSGARSGGLRSGALGGQPGGCEAARGGVLCPSPCAPPPHKAAAAVELRAPPLSGLVGSCWASPALHGEASAGGRRRGRAGRGVWGGPVRAEPWGRLGAGGGRRRDRGAAKGGAGRAGSLRCCGGAGRAAREAPRCKQGGAPPGAPSRSPGGAAGTAAPRGAAVGGTGRRAAPPPPQPWSGGFRVRSVTAVLLPGACRCAEFYYGQNGLKRNKRRYLCTRCAALSLITAELTWFRLIKARAEQGRPWWKRCSSPRTGGCSASRLCWAALRNARHGLGAAAWSGARAECFQPGVKCTALPWYSFPSPSFRTCPSYSVGLCFNPHLIFLGAHIYVCILRTATAVSFQNSNPN